MEDDGDEPDLFKTPTHEIRRNVDPETSDEAAEALTKSGKSARLEKLVRDLVFKAQWQGLTAHEASEISGINLQSITPRFAKLRKQGLIVLATDYDGKIIKRTNPSTNRGAQISWTPEFVPRPMPWDEPTP